MMRTPSGFRVALSLLALGAVAAGGAACEVDAPGPLPESGTAARPLQANFRENCGVGIGVGPVPMYQTVEHGAVEVLDGIQVRSGWYVDAIRFRYRNRVTGISQWRPWVGGPGGTPQREILLERGEGLVSFSASWSPDDGTVAIHYLSTMTFTTSHGRTFGQFGTVAGYGVHTCSASSGTFQGFAIDYNPYVLTRIWGANHRLCEDCEEAPQGGGGAWGLDAAVEGSFRFQGAAGEILSGVQVRTSDRLNAIHFKWRRVDGTEYWAPWAGGTDGTEQREFLLGPDERFVGVIGGSGSLIDRIGFITSTGGMGGPWGGGGGIPFTHETEAHGGLRHHIVEVSGTIHDGSIAHLSVAESPASTCAHVACVEGVRLDPACDLGVKKICAADPYCCSDAWDGVCVNEVASVAGLTCTPN